MRFMMFEFSLAQVLQLDSRSEKEGMIKMLCDKNMYLNMKGSKGYCFFPFALQKGGRGTDRLQLQ